MAAGARPPAASPGAARRARHAAGSTHAAPVPLAPRSHPAPRRRAPTRSPALAFGNGRSLLRNGRSAFPPPPRSSFLIPTRRDRLGGLSPCGAKPSIGRGWRRPKRGMKTRGWPFAPELHAWLGSEQLSSNETWSPFRPAPFTLFIYLHSHDTLRASRTLAAALSRAESRGDGNVRLTTYGKYGHPCPARNTHGTPILLFWCRHRNRLNIADFGDRSKLQTEMTWRKVQFAQRQRKVTRRFWMVMGSLVLASLCLTCCQDTQ